MANLNKVFLIGRLTRDPELRYIQSGTAVADFGLAVNRQYSTPDGEKKEEVTFVDITVWGKRAEVCAEHLGKGKPVFVEGRLKLDTWESKEGQKRSKLVVVMDNFQFLGPSPSRGAGGAPPEAAASGPPAEAAQAGAPIADEEIPF
jgi:single-strand DNA-binding protein